MPLALVIQIVGNQSYKHTFLDNESSSRGLIEYETHYKCLSATVLVTRNVRVYLTSLREESSIFLTSRNAGRSCRTSQSLFKRRITVIWFNNIHARTLYEDINNHEIIDILLTGKICTFIFSYIFIQQDARHFAERTRL